MPVQRFILIVFFLATNLLQGIAQSTPFTDTLTVTNASVTKPAVNSYAQHSVLAQGVWTRWAVNQTGVYKLTYEQLLSAGLPLPAASQYIRVFGNGGAMLPEKNEDARQDDLAEVACVVYDGGDGLINATGDYVMFYAEGPMVWRYNNLSMTFSHQMNLYSDDSYYFVNISETSGKRVTQPAALTDAPALQLDNYRDRQVHEMELYNLIHSGKIWYGEVFNNQLLYNFPFDVSAIDLTRNVLVQASMAARAADTSNFKLSLWGISDTVMIDQVNPNVNTDYVKNGMLQQYFAASTDPCNITVEYLPVNQNSTGWLNYIEVFASRKLSYQGAPLLFRNPEAIGAGVVQYNLTGLNSALLLWDVTDPWNTRQLSVLLSGTDGYFRQQSDTLNEYILFDPANALTAVFIDNVINQDLHATAFPDMVIVSHPDFLAQAERLADFHRNTDDLEVVVWQPQQIYNEFSSGMQDPTAIRDYLRMLYERARDNSALIPRYLLLFGDGSYDPKNRLTTNSNYIPTYQTWNSILPTSSYVSDDYFGLLDDGEGPNASGLIDVGIGRLPAESEQDARILVDKILRYNSPVDLLPPSSNPAPDQISNFADWRNIITFIADDEDGNLHFKQAEELVGIVDSLTFDLNIIKVYLDAYQQEQTELGPRYPGADLEFNERVMRGSLIVNYTGHGGETGLADERVLEISDIDNWGNYFNLPVFITATCEFSRYDNPSQISAGEHMLLSEQGGAIALYSTTRVAYAHTNMIINSNLLDATFDDGSAQRLGDIIRNAKVKCGATVYMQNFTLLGDPALRLAIPQQKVIASSLNGDSLALGDTILAGTQITLQGYVADAYDQLLSSFEGEVSCTVFDKRKVISTLANDAASMVAPFAVQQEVIFKGRAMVEHGLFSFTFTLPRDVAFSEGNARVSFYAKSLDSDATGCYSGLVLEPNAECGVGNNQGPNIGLYLNDRGFILNGITTSNVKLIADIEDTDGVNFFSAGLGHDIILVIDNDFNTPLVMNNYFAPALGNSGQGSVEYNIENLSEGPHKLWLRAWDVLNFSSDAETQFVVKETNNLSLNHVEVYPNPMTRELHLCFDRNQTNGIQWLSILIKTVDGKQVWATEQQISATESLHLCNVWDGCDVNGKNLPAGLYIYQMKVTDDTGDFKQWSGKISKLE